MSFKKQKKSQKLQMLRYYKLKQRSTKTELEEK